MGGKRSIGVAGLQRSGVTRRVTRKISELIAIALSFALLGCAQPSARERVCTGEIVRVENVAGQHYSPTKGEKPLTRLVLRMAAPGTAHAEVVRISILDIYSADLYGKTGDTVTFTWPDMRRLEDVWIDQLKDYQVVPRNSKR